MGVDRWEQEHRSYRPGRPPPAADPEPEQMPVSETEPSARKAAREGYAQPKGGAKARPTKARPMTGSD